MFPRALSVKVTVSTRVSGASKAISTRIATITPHAPGFQRDVAACEWVVSAMVVILAGGG